MNPLTGCGTCIETFTFRYAKIIKIQSHNKMTLDLYYLVIDYERYRINPRQYAPIPDDRVLRHESHAQNSRPSSPPGGI